MCPRQALAVPDPGDQRAESRAFTLYHYVCNLVNASALDGNILKVASIFPLVLRHLQLMCLRRWTLLQD